jgi:hypothetical protein
MRIVLAVALFTLTDNCDTDIAPEKLNMVASVFAVSDPLVYRIAKFAAEAGMESIGYKANPAASIAVPSFLVAPKPNNLFQFVVSFAGSVAPPPFVFLTYALKFINDITWSFTT